MLSHGIVLGSDGQKMSKSLRNYPDVSEVFDRDGSDAMRWFLMASSVIRGGNIVVTEEGIREGVRQLLLPLWSTYYFFTLYANASKYEAKRRVDSSNVLDRYLLAKTHDLLVEVTAQLEALDSPLAAQALRDFADVLTNWYVRRSRDRFWVGDDTAAFDTLYTVLETVARAAAPLMPLIGEEMWRGLTGERSVHLADWPDAAEFPVDPELVTAMDEVRAIASVGLALRKTNGLRVRLPLSRLTVVTETREELLRPFVPMLMDELNVKEIDLLDSSEDVADRFGVRSQLYVNARQLGPRLGKDVQRVIAAAKAGNWKRTDEGVQVFGDDLDVMLLAGEFVHDLVSDDPERMAFFGEQSFVVLDTVLTPELEAEGLARDVIRAVQDARKAAGFDVSDRIKLTISTPELAALQTHSEMISAETLSVETRLLESPDGASLVIDVVKAEGPVDV